MFTCPINYDYEECSAYEYKNDCGNCEHTQKLTDEELRALLTIALQRTKTLKTYYNEVCDAVKNLGNKLNIML